MITIVKPDGVIYIAASDELEITEVSNINNYYIKINNKDWIISPFKSLYRTEYVANDSTTIHIFRSIISSMYN